MLLERSYGQEASSEAAARSADAESTTASFERVVGSGRPEESSSGRKEKSRSMFNSGMIGQPRLVPRQT
jgi:hypothetical protein